MTEILDIVNEKDEVIGQMKRDDADVKDRKHIVRKVFIGFYTPNKQIILQLRSKTKKSNPDKLTVTTSGHVESGWSYDDTAIKESYEETGIRIDPTKLKSLGVVFDRDNYDMRAIYAYPFDGDISDLKIEDGDGAGFIVMPISDLRQKRIDNPEKFVPFITSKYGDILFDYIEQN
jgi:8-oxo-dGTP pyrophosphatase MutT (NUDIX family)